jgi:protein-S-isoprenylcysteine O-methyltransferase Ste14
MALFRAAAMRRRGIKALLFGASDRRDFLLIPGLLLMAYALLARVTDLPLWKPLVASWGDAPLFGWLGVALLALALGGFAASLVSFGDSFRVGIDDQKPDRLITAGMFAFSRNPIYVCFIAFFIGQFLIHRNILLALAAGFFIAAIHRQVLREEKFLRAHYGADYRAYCRRVRRYL